MVITRRYRDSDAPVIAALTIAAIRQTALKAYSPEQVAAWSARYAVERLVQGRQRATGSKSRSIPMMPRLPMP